MDYYYDRLDKVGAAESAALFLLKKGATLEGMIKEIEGLEIIEFLNRYRPEGELKDEGYIEILRQIVKFFVTLNYWEGEDDSLRKAVITGEEDPETLEKIVLYGHYEGFKSDDLPWDNTYIS